MTLQIQGKEFKFFAARPTIPPPKGPRILLFSEKVIVGLSGVAASSPSTPPQSTFRIRKLELTANIVSDPAQAVSKDLSSLIKPEIVAFIKPKSPPPKEPAVSRTTSDPSLLEQSLDFKPEDKEEVPTEPDHM